MTKYTINFAPIEIKGDTTVLIGRQPYDRDKLDALRREFRETHVFRRDGADNVILDVPVSAGQKPIGNIQEELDLARYQKLWPPLLSAALLRAFSGVRDIISDRPVSVVGALPRGLVRHPNLPQWMQKRTLLRFDTRSIYAAGEKQMLGLVCETRIKNLIQGSCAELLALGISPLGRYVQVEEEPHDPRLMKKRRLVGRVAAIESGTLVLDDHAEGFATIPATEAFLEARREIFDDCINQILGSNAGAVLKSAESAAAALHSGPGRKEQIDDALKYLREKASLEPVPGAKFAFGPMLLSDNNGFPVTETIPKPLF